MKAWSKAERQHFRRVVVRWYEQTARTLPWRGTRDPYAIWVSEIMLQQTQVVTVLPYFRRFLQEFPTVSHLARARQQDVLRHWEGLGYYRRATQLHAAARQISRQHQGQLPRSLEELQRLPGIGKYTAGAILSFAFDEPRPILEANTTRLWCRVLGYRDDPSRSAGQRVLWQAAQEILPRRGSGPLNQALMELGSRVCRPTAPQCSICPVTAHCAAFRHGDQARIPRRRARRPAECVTEAAVVIRRGGRVLLRQCQSQERWAGLWDYPRFRVHAEQKKAGELYRQIVRGVQQQVGIRVRVHEGFLQWQHGVTHYDITLLCFRATYLGTHSAPATLGFPIRWLWVSQLERYPQSVTGRRISKQLRNETPGG